MLRRMVRGRSPAAALVLLLGVGCVNYDAARAEDAAPSAVDITWSVRIPLRDGVGLNATVYRPKEQRAPAPCIFTHVQGLELFSRRRHLVQVFINRRMA